MFVALDDVFAGGIEPDAGDEIDASADVPTQIEFAAAANFGCEAALERGWRFLDGERRRLREPAVGAAGN